MLTSVNLSLSSKCGANCIFCPSDLGRSIAAKIMSLDTAAKIILEISELNALKKNNITHLQIGEQGDAFLNPNIIEILELVKKQLPYITVCIFTNFQNLTKEKLEIILKNKLIDNWNTNIDGYEKSYYKVKRINFKDTISNVRSFVLLRDRYYPEASLTVFILSFKSYVKTIYKHFGFIPLKVKNNDLFLADDFYKTEKFLYKKIINPEKDKVIRSAIFGWAEREKIAIDNIEYDNYQCPMISRIKEEAFIAPDGSWYACCYDSKNELNLGNVMESSIEYIYNSKRRSQFIEDIENKRFSLVGGPCLTIPACEKLNDDYSPVYYKIKKWVKKCLGRD